MQDEDGNFVDDFIVSTQNDLVIQNITSNREPSVLLENVSVDNRLGRHLAISPDGNRVALAQDDGNIHVVHVQSAFTTQLEGVRYPEFSASSRFLIGTTGSTIGRGDLKIFNLDNNALQDTLTSVRGMFSVDSHRDFIFYYSSKTDTKEEGLRAYSIEKGTEIIIFDREDFDNYKRSTSNGKQGAILSPPALIGTDRDGRIHFITEVNLFRLDDC